MNEYRNVLLCSEDEIKTFGNISDNVDGKYISPAIYTAQRQDLEETCGTELVKKIQYLIGTGEIELVENSHYKWLLDEYITDYMIYASITELIPILSFKINNMGANRTEDEKVYSLSYNEVFALQDHYKHQADYFKYRLQRFLIANYADYPELVTYKSIEDLQSNLYSAAGCSLWLGGARTPKNAQKPSLKDIYNFPSNSNKKKGGK